MANLLTTLARLDRTKVFLATLALGLVGMFLPQPFGALLIYLVIGALAALLSKTWAVTPPILRVARLAILALLAVIATVRLLD